MSKDTDYENIMEILLLSLLVPAISSLSLSMAALARLSPLSASCLYTLSCYYSYYYYCYCYCLNSGLVNTPG